MTSLGFENYAEALKIYLSKYREVSCYYCLPIEDSTVLQCLLVFMLIDRVRHSLREVRIHSDQAAPTVRRQVKELLGVVI